MGHIRFRGLRKVRRVDGKDVVKNEGIPHRMGTMMGENDGVIVTAAIPAFLETIFHEMNRWSVYIYTLR